MHVNFMAHQSSINKIKEDLQGKENKMKINTVKSKREKRDSTVHNKIKAGLKTQAALFSQKWKCERTLSSVN